MNKYIYDGPVWVFDKLVVDRWQSETTAVSESKARSNLCYRYKKAHNLIKSAKVTLPGEITMIG